MVVKDILSIYIVAICCLGGFARATFVTLDLLLENSTDSVAVVHSEHYGLASVEFYPNDGYTVNKVTQGDLPVWAAAKNEVCKSAILYFGKDPLSLLYLNVQAGNSSVYKYFVKVSGQWREVVENTLKLLIDIDRSSYSAKNLDDFAVQILDQMPQEVSGLTLFHPKSYSFFIKPIYSCDLEICDHNTIYIMKQNIVGTCFGHLFTPRTDYSISLVTYKGRQLWSKSDNQNLCSSVWTYFKGDFDELIVIRLHNINTNAPSSQYFVKSEKEISAISLKEFEKLLTEMSLAEYDQKDIECYKDGFLKSRDFAFILNPLFAIIVAASAVLYSM